MPIGGNTLAQTAPRSRAADDLESRSGTDWEETQLFSAAMTGCEDALRAVWERNRRWIAAVLLAHKPAGEDLEDLLQEVAVTLVGKVSTLREAGHLRAWLRAVAINTARAAGRRSRYRNHQRLGLGAADWSESALEVAPRNEAVSEERIERTLERVRQLPMTYREPLLLRATQGLRSAQIADILDIPSATVDTRIARARRMLSEMMQRDDHAQTRTEGPLGSVR